MNPIQVSSRDFDSIMADINSDAELRDKPDWWKRMIAGIGDVLSIWENASANQAFLRTAFTRRAVADLCALIDYQIGEQVTASGNILFDVNPSAILPITVAIADLVASTSGGVTASARRFESRTPLTVSSLTEVTASGVWNTGTGQITVVGSYTTGEKIRLTTSGTMPTPYSLLTDYYAIRVDATHIKLASSRANAYNGVGMGITAAGSGNHTLTRLSRSVPVFQQATVPNASIGVSDGTTEWQEYVIAQVGVLVDTLIVTVNSVTWTRVDTFVYSGPTDKHYRVLFDTDGSAKIQFGDGIYGAIPGAFDIEVEYAYGGGVTANVSSLNAISVYSGGDANIVGCSNPTAITGGADAEAIETAKRLAPLLLKARDRFVTVEDGEALVLAYGGVSQVAVLQNFYGVLSVKVVGIANGGGDVSAPNRALIQTYLIDRTVLESMDVRFEAATITAKAVTSAAHMRPGYVWTAVQPFFRLAWKLLLSEAGQEIFDTYIADGIAEAVVKIDLIFTETFTSADYTKIGTILTMFSRMPPRAFGDSIEISDVYAFVQGTVDGIDYMTIAAPAFPISTAIDEITTYGALTLTEIP